MTTSERITTFTFVIDSPSAYIELPRIVPDVKYIAIRQLKYRKITDGQEMLLLKLSSGSGVHMNSNIFFNGITHINCVKAFYLGPTNSTTLYESNNGERYTIQLNHPEPIATLTFDFMIDATRAVDISPTNKLILTIDFIAVSMA